MKDKEFTENILRGDPSCWKDFVERYTDWMLYTAWKFERKFCRRPARNTNCGLLHIMRQRKGDNIHYRSDVEDCDEGIELYLWILRQLKGRLKSFRGESKLSTYIWTILNSKSLHVDILRWKYGRVDEHNEKRLPVAIKKLPDKERKLFVLLRRRKDESFIRTRLELNEDDLREAVGHVREALLQAGQLDLIERPELQDSEPWDIENEGKFQIRQQCRDQEEATTNHIFYRQTAELLGTALNSLKPTEQRLLKLYYHEGLSAKEIARFCSELGTSLEVDGVPVDSKNAYYLLGKVTDKVATLTNLQIDGQEITRKQWMKILTILGQEEIW